MYEKLYKVLKFLHYPCKKKKTKNVFLEDGNFTSAFVRYYNHEVFKFPFNHIEYNTFISEIEVDYNKGVDLINKALEKANGTAD